MFRILIIEDEDFYRKFLVKIIQKRHRCDAVKTSAEAQEHLSTRSYDIVLYDLRLPGLSGRELIHYVKSEIDPDIINVVITGYDEDWTPVDATEENIFYYLKKGDFKPDELLKIIDSGCQLRKMRLKEKKYISDQIATEGVTHAGKLAASIAHEINNPLQSLYLIIGLLKDELHGKNYRKSMIKELGLMEKGVERIRSIVKQLLHLYRIDCSPNGVDHADAVFRKAVSFLRPIAREQNTEIILSDTAGDGQVLVSSNYFFYALVNICMKILDESKKSITIDPHISGDSARIEITSILKSEEAGEGESGQRSDYGVSFNSILSKGPLGKRNGSVSVQKKKNGQRVVLDLPLFRKTADTVANIHSV
jgi:CheY-like chemotaxis protein